MKKTSALILTISLSLLSFFGVGIILYLQNAHEDFEENIHIEESDSSGSTTTETLEIKDLDLYPGAEREYIINLTCEVEGEYTVSVKFANNDNKGLENFLAVDVGCADVLYSEELLKLFDSEAISFTCYLKTGESTPLTIRFAMPESVGNEAQGKEAKFDIDISISKAED